MMKHSQRTLRRVGFLAGSSLLALAAIGPAASPALAKPSGSIWTTGEDCSALAPQNDNSYLVGETVHVRGSNFAASSTFTWSITGKPGGASGDPNQEVTSGGGTTDSAGAFCVAAYVIDASDWGEYSVEVQQGSTRKNDNYSVEPGDAQEPEGDGDDPSDPPADEETTPPADEETTPSSDEETTPPVDDPSDPPADEETTPPADDPSDPPADEETTPPVDDETTPPTEELPVEKTDDSNIPPVEETDPSDETEAAADTDTDTDAPADDSTPSDSGSTETLSQEVLGVVSDGPTVTPPPTDTIVAPSDQGGGAEWRMIVAFLGILILVATIGLPDRRRAA